MKIYNKSNYIESRTIGEKEGCPTGWTRTSPGEEISGKTQLFSGKRWIYVDSSLIPSEPPVALDLLKTDKWYLPADGTTFATVTYTSNSTVYFAIESTITAVEPVDKVATIEITADAPGPIRVDVQDKRLVIAALEVE